MNNIILAFILCFISSGYTFAQSGLQVTYGAKGVQTISYQGVTLEDVGQFPSDSFHVWHMKSTDMQGNVVSTGQYGWGEANNAEAWDPGTNTETYTFTWGTVATQFVQNGNNLDMIVTETNNAGSGIVFDGAQIFPFALHFPQDPVNFYGYTQYAITTTGPGVGVADYGSGVVTSVIPNESVALYGGWQNMATNTYAPSMTSTAPDNLAPFLPHNDVPLMPGNSFTYTVSLRFTPEGTAANAADAYASFAATYPSRMTWTDKRVIGTSWVASSPTGISDSTQPGGFPTNPRRYFNDPAVDITTPSGLQAFQDRMLAQAAANVTNAQGMSAQGVITWDIEGEEYPMNTSYVCSPDQIAAIAPEMESVVTDTDSLYYGQRLDDAYFKTMSSAGLKVGLCLRPQVFTLASNGTASQAYLTTNAAIISNLENKATYAHARWGATIFYVDSVVDTYGGTLDPAIFQQLITDLPGFLFVPEESTPRYYAYSAPFYTFMSHLDLGTPASTYNFYPNAFGANLINDVDPGTLATYQPQLTQSVRNGDILMGHADWWQPNDSTIVAIYQAAGVRTPPPTKTTPIVTWNTPAAIPYGSALSAAQLNASANVPGTFTYSPGAGTAPGAGSTILLVTFTPSDTNDYTTATASVTLTVTQATPSISWATPASISAGTALSAAQLNASASVPGTFAYAPSAGTVLSAGTYSLNITFTPSDTTDYKIATASVSLTVSQASKTTPVISWAAPASITSGTPLSAAQLNASANVPGSYVYIPPAGTVLGAGTYTLSVAFTPSDATDYATAAATVPLTVSAVSPTTNIAILSPVSGATLSGSIVVAGQVNLNLDSAGTFLMVDGVEVGTRRVTSAPFIYPLDTTTLTNGPHTLQLWGHDIGNNTTISAPVSVVVAN